MILLAAAGLIAAGVYGLSQSPAAAARLAAVEGEHGVEGHGAEGAAVESLAHGEGVEGSPNALGRGQGGPGRGLGGGGRGEGGGIHEAASLERGLPELGKTMVVVVGVAAGVILVQKLAGRAARKPRSA
jgi:hypothetical protein